MSKWPGGSVNIGNNIYYIVYLPNPFPSGLEVDLEGSNTFPTFMLLIYIDSLGLFNHLCRYLFNCITMWQGSWASATALHKEFGWYYTIAMSDWCSVH